MPATTSTGLDEWGTPSDEDLAAIITAIELCTSAPTPPDENREELPRWRFSGRWWSKPVPVRRDRPF
ncbi:MAG: hypothetical protein N2037_05930 [Acidimicrobiales bacterium]|nr:hypothetical protein [Acidimicrobiales bacterium]